MNHVLDSFDRVLTRAVAKREQVHAILQAVAVRIPPVEGDEMANGNQNISGPRAIQRLDDFNHIPKAAHGSGLGESQPKACIHSQGKHATNTT